MLITRFCRILLGGVSKLKTRFIFETPPDIPSPGYN